ncbi:MAG TPA: substrate-binding domain-containing protein [Conexibacter sp.]|jgi:ABC-type sugar transport system substrate-binding protein|nr:substrate-binding domain-containing protein [Conexibacter sp.]
MNGEPIDRRTLLRTGVGALLGAGAASALAACGSGGDSGPHARAVARRSIAIDYASYYPPVADLRRLVERRAHARGAAITFSDDAAGVEAQHATLRTWTGPRGGFRAIVVAPFDAAAVAPLARAALARDVQVVSYLTPLPQQTARIVADPARCGRLLARDVAGWAARSLGDHAQALLVRPPARPAVPDPVAPLAPVAERALLDELARRAPGVQAVAATEGQGTADAQAAVARALRDYPQVRVVLCWNDATAAGAARALGEHLPEGEHARRYAGGVALPGIATRATLQDLRHGGILRCLVAPRLRDLADALVDLPYGLLQGRAPQDARVPVRALNAEAGQLVMAYARDYRLG